MAGVLGLVTLLGACGATTAKCEQLINETVAQVQGVESVEAGCRESFGSSSAGAGTVHLTAKTKPEADEIIARIEEAMARNPEIEPDWRGPSVIYLEDGTWFGTGGREVRVSREMLGIEP
ncbi:hypothetical protein ACQEVI_06880 [Promicromonospora sp. CA-289599]|uniref:hypothetical protein n=1 Tax=Promicromonospora sp. CA-289599 TaxID=3240014 RepID=UPI003D93797C